MKGIRKNPCFHSSITLQIYVCVCVYTSMCIYIYTHTYLQAEITRIASNLDNTFYTTDYRHIQPEVLVSLISHFSTRAFVLTVQINVLAVVDSDVWQGKKYKQSIQLINIEVVPYRTGSGGIIRPRRQRNLSIHSTNPNSYLQHGYLDFPMRIYSWNGPKYSSPIIYGLCPFTGIISTLTTSELPSSLTAPSETSVSILCYPEIILHVTSSNFFIVSISFPCPCATPDNMNKLREENQAILMRQEMWSSLGMGPKAGTGTFFQTHT